MKFTGELYRVAGSAASQQAATYAKEVKGYQASSSDWACKGIYGCWIVFDTLENAKKSSPSLIYDYNDVKVYPI